MNEINTGLDALGALGLNTEVIEKAEAATIYEGAEVLESGIFTGRLKLLGTFKGNPPTSADLEKDKDAIASTQLKMVVEIDYTDGEGKSKTKEFTSYQNVNKKKQTKDAQGNLTGIGEPNEIGQSTMIQALFASCNVGTENVAVKFNECLKDGSVTSIKTKEKCYKAEKDFTSFNSVINKPVKVYLRKVQEGKDLETARFYNEVEAVADMNHQNKAGADLRETFEKKIEKQPTLIRDEKEKYDPKANKAGTGAGVKAGAGPGVTL